MKKSILTSLLIGSLGLSMMAQEITVEPKTHEISKRAKNSGSIVDHSWNDKGDVFSLSYFTKMKEDFFGDPKQLQFEIYNFDKDFNFINMEDPVWDLKKARTKYKKFNFKGEVYEEEGITVVQNLAAQLVLKKKLTKYKWDWFNGGYYKTTTLLDKTKLKDDEDNRLGHINHYEFEDENGNYRLSIFASSLIAEGPNKGGMRFTTLLVDYDLNVLKKESFEIPYIVYHNGTNLINEFEDAYYTYVLQPKKAWKGAGIAPTSTTCTFVKIDAKTLQVVSNYTFETPAIDWRPKEYYIDGNDVYAVGPISISNKAFATDAAIFKPALKACPNLYIAKFGETKQEYGTNMTPAEMLAALKMPVGVKGKMKPISDMIYNYFEVINGELYMVGKNYMMKKTSNGTFAVAKDAILMNFAQNGKLKGYYGFPTPRQVQNKVFLNSKGDKVYWFVFTSGSKEGYEKPKGNLMSINLSDNTISGVKTLGTGDKISISTTLPIIEGPNNEFVAVFGTQGGRENLYFGKVKLD
jgi:hypothetical protein